MNIIIKNNPSEDDINQEVERRIREKTEYVTTCRGEIEKLENKAIDINEELIKVIDKIAEGDRLAKSAQQEMLLNAETLADINLNKGSLTTEMSVMN